MFLDARDDRCLSVRPVCGGHLLEGQPIKRILHSVVVLVPSCAVSIKRHGKNSNKINYLYDRLLATASM